MDCCSTLALSIDRIKGGLVTNKSSEIMSKVLQQFKPLNCKNPTYTHKRSVSKVFIHLKKTMK